MHSLLLVLLLLVPVGGAFGEAVAEGVDAGDGGISVEIEVEAPGATSVVVHVIDPGDDQLTLPMNARTGGVFAASAKLERADLVVVFEILDGGRAIVSRPLTLSELGVDPAVLGFAVEPSLLQPAPEIPEDDGIITAAIRRNLWLAVAFGAAAAVAFGLLGRWSEGGFPAPDSSRPRRGSWKVSPARRILLRSRDSQGGHHRRRVVDCRGGSLFMEGRL